MKIEKDSQDWHNFDKGTTIGKKGSEGGTILIDLENVNGARITLEKDCYHNVPFAITFGIYGLLFHTHFKPQMDQAEQYITWVASRMSKIFDMYELAEDHRDDEWYNEHDRLVHELTID